MIPAQGAAPPDGRDLRAAIEALARRKASVPRQKPSSGCGIKWKR